MILLSFSVYGVTPSCGEHISSSVTFDSNLICNQTYDVGDESTFYINGSDILIDCNSYNITQLQDYTPIFVVDDDTDNVTITNCGFFSDVVSYEYNGYILNNFNLINNYWEYEGDSDWIAFSDTNTGVGWTNSVVSGNEMHITSSTEAFAYITYTKYADNFTFIDNKIYLNYNKTGYFAFFNFYCGGDKNINFSNNDIINLGTQPIFYVQTCNNHLKIYNNNISASTVGVLDEFNVSVNSEIGNYYGSCTDTDFDGFCDEQFNSGTWYDDNALSEYYWIPYVAPPIEEVWSPTYDMDDFAPALFDGIGRMLLTFVAFAGLIVMVLIGSWGFRKIKGKR